MSGLQPSASTLGRNLGLRPRLVYVGPSALFNSTNCCWKVRTTEAVCPPIFRRLSDSVVVMNQGHQPPLPTVEITLIIPPCSKLLPQCARMEFWLRTTSVYN